MEELTSRTVFHEIRLKSDVMEEFDGGILLPDPDWEGPVSESADGGRQAANSDDEWDTDLEEAGETPRRRFISEDQARQVYLAACRQLDIVPAHCFVKGVDTDVINLNFQGLGARGTRAVATAMVLDRMATQLLLAGNVIGREGVRFVCDMLRENDYLTCIDLSENGLDSAAAELLASVFRENDTLQSLKLAGNNFKDRDAEHFAAILAIGQFTGLRKLDLSHNNFGDVGAEILGKALDNNETLTELNLAWNQIRKDGIHHISKGIADNNSLKLLDLSGNGVDNDAADCIGRALAANRYLITLNLASNRIGLQGVVYIFTGIAKNETLNTILLTGNPLTQQGPTAALKLLQQSETSVLEKLEIADACVAREFYSVLEEVQQRRPKFQVVVGGFMDGRDMCKAAAKTSQQSWTRDPVLVFIHFLESREIKVFDLFKQMDADRNCSLTREELVTGLGRLGCPLDTRQLDQLINALDVDHSGEIDVEEFLDGVARHSRRFSKWSTGSRKSSSGSRLPSQQSDRPSSSNRPTPDAQQDTFVSTDTKTLPPPVTDFPVTNDVSRDILLTVPRGATVS
ncbi:leucine-rich repeat-containing protein 74B-like isoform X2 [Mya arenaria]|uniref:leucine-rich repeat-containing protein 74B-like isoform X2 n=1 Tax=Mya arenaria TaxID=6604 RepID=UPI0022E14804|nr:leucine-rich repeat-containing protein 74B-like isoform X2 [Mya arenaria]